MEWGMNLLSIMGLHRGDFVYLIPSKMKELHQKKILSPYNYVPIAERGTPDGLMVTGFKNKTYTIGWTANVVREVSRRGRDELIVREFIVDGVHTRAGENLRDTEKILRQAMIDRLKPEVLMTIKKIIGGDIGAAQACVKFLVDADLTKIGLPEQVEKILGISADDKPSALFARRKELFDEYVTLRDIAHRNRGMEPRSQLSVSQ